MDELKPFDWLYDYSPEARQESYILRPVVPIQFVGLQGQRTDRFEALVDSGAENILTPRWVAMAIGIEPEGRETNIRIGGSTRRVQFGDVDLELIGPDGKAVRWRAEVGFMDWTDPPWLVILGQTGFFSQFSVCMSRLSQKVAIQHRDSFDHEYGIGPS